MSDNLDNLIEKGFEFNPTAEKLINGFLIPWVTGQNPLWNGVVEKTIYGDSFLWEIFSDIESCEADVRHWTMHEYSLSGESVKKSGRANAANLVVCKITKTVKKKDKSVHNTNQGIFNGDYQVQCAQPESYDDGANYERFAPDIYEEFSSEYIGSNGDYQVQAAQPESYDDGSNYARFAPDTNESPSGISYRDRYDAPAAQPEPYGDGLNHVRLAPNTTEGFLSENRGNGGGYQAPAAQLESYGNGSNYMRLAPDTNEVLAPDQLELHHRRRSGEKEKKESAKAKSYVRLFAFFCIDSVSHDGFQFSFPRIRTYAVIGCVQTVR
ncbi:hypothetical protein SASPL_139382 [Salvia splendens]|uniref:Uncharacterized protein n=1 Tax=Salvia splendens TaxID=180675 RepID=A0A8X8ZAC7_SALSN|nr:hypothetical protein SASPL_139382 [Salvia splendens]